MNLTEVHNRDAEEMLVSAGFRAEGTLQRQIVSEVSAESLYSETCRNAWRMLVDLLSEGVDLFDPTAFITAAQRFDRWRELVSVTTKNPSALNWRHYHKIVTGHAAVRKQAAVYLNGLRRLTDSVQVESEEDPTSIASDSATALHSLLTGGARTTSVNQRQAMRKVLDRLQELQRRANAGDLITARTGVPALDQILPYREDSIVTLVAPSGTGKSSLMAQVGLFTAASGGGVTLFTHEMSCEDMETRVISQMETIHEGNLSQGIIYESDWGKLSRAGLALRDLPLRIDECPANIDALEQGMRYAHAVHGSTWFIIDYAQLIQVGGVHARKPKHERMEHLGERLLAIRRELKCGILLLAQTTNAPSGPKWAITDCDNGRGLKQPSDVMMVMYQDGEQEPSIILDRGKHRRGGKDEEQLPFIAGRISDPSSRSLDEECQRRRTLLATYQHDRPESVELDESDLIAGRVFAALAGEDIKPTTEQMRKVAELLGVNV